VSGAAPGWLACRRLIVRCVGIGATLTLPRSGPRRSRCWSCECRRRCCRVVALQLEVDRRHLERHLVAPGSYTRKSWRSADVPCHPHGSVFSQKPSGFAGRCARSSQFSLGDMCCKSAIHGVPSVFSRESPSLGELSCLRGFSRSTAVHRRAQRPATDPCRGELFQVFHRPLGSFRVVVVGVVHVDALEGRRVGDISGR